jgi:Leucine-rich repeat (LRR) protein
LANVPDPLQGSGAGAELANSHDTDPAHAAAMVLGGANVAEPSSQHAPPQIEVALLDVLRLVGPWLPRVDKVQGARHGDVPPEIAHDSRQRLAFRLGAEAARQFGLEPAAHGTAGLVALGRQVVVDHVLAGKQGHFPLLLVIARQEGALDEAAWAANDKETIADQAHAFFASIFKPDIDYCSALLAIAAIPPLRSRRQLADDLLREHGIDPEALPFGADIRYAYQGVAMFTPPLVNNWVAGEFYFNKDVLTAEHIRGMRLLGGGRPSPAQAERIVAALPRSLDAEFDKRFLAYNEQMSAQTAKWLTARVSLHARDNRIDLSNAKVTISHPRRESYQMETQVLRGSAFRYQGSTQAEFPSPGYLVTIDADGARQRYFVSHSTGEIKALPPVGDLVDWVNEHHDLVFGQFQASAGLAEAGKGPDEPGGVMQLRVCVKEMAGGDPATMAQWLAPALQADVERMRDTVRGQTPAEWMTDTLLNFIPFRQMIVSIQKGDWQTAIVAGGRDTLFLLLWAAMGVRLTTAALRAGAPLGNAGAALGGMATRRGISGLRSLADGIPMLRHGIKSSLTGTVSQSWGRLRPLDAQRISAALKPAFPKLAQAMEQAAARARGPTIVDGVWHVVPTPGAVPEAADGIRTASILKAHGGGGRELTLLRYGNSAAVYTQYDPGLGQRIGAILLADGAGRLYQTLPLNVMERYRVRIPEVLQGLGARRAGADATIILDDRHYVRIGDDYVEVAMDRAVSTTDRPIWRAVAPDGVSPDGVAHRLVHDAEKAMWRLPETPALYGGGRFMAGRSVKPGAVEANAGSTGFGMLQAMPTALQRTRFIETLVSRIPGVTARQTVAAQRTLSRIDADPRGRAILGALWAHHNMLREAPEIVLREAGDVALTRPSLNETVRGRVWNMDLDALAAEPTESAVNELAAVYNNMTGILQGRDPFDALMSQGKPAMDRKLEQAWAQWLSVDRQSGLFIDAASNGEGLVHTSRYRAIAMLRLQLQELRCYGGLDRPTLHGLLEGRQGTAIPTMRVDLSQMRLDSIPPLPDDIEALDIAHNTIDELANLPKNLKILKAESAGITKLPMNWPRGLVDLDLSSNELSHLPPWLPSGLTRLTLAGNSLTTLPPLPETLEDLGIHYNSFTKLPDHLPGRLKHIRAIGNRLSTVPENLPPGLETLDVANNRLTELPYTLPAGLKTLKASENQLRRLPGTLPARLEMLSVSNNRLTTLPHLPRGLVTLLVNSNALDQLPAHLPRSLEKIMAADNMLGSLPNDLPVGLRVLGVTGNQLTRIPDSINTLTSCDVYVERNPISMEDIPAIGLNQPGPRIYFSMQQAHAAARNESRTMREAVQHWLKREPDDVLAQWDAICQEMAVSKPDAALEFTGFLDRLRGTVVYREAALHAEVTSWLRDVAKPERAALRQDALAICTGATETCDDRVVSVWDSLKQLRFNDDIRIGRYDDRPADVVQAARQMFRLKILQDIARRKASSIRAVDQVEVYLGFAVKLKTDLDLTTVVPEMNFFGASGVTQSDLDRALLQVQAREAEEFDKFFVVDYEPWQTVLKRKHGARYDEAKATLGEQLVGDDFKRRVDAKLAEVQLGPNDADARRQMESTVARTMQYQALAPLSREHLASASVAYRPAES